MRRKRSIRQLSVIKFDGINGSVASTSKESVKCIGGRGKCHFHSNEVKKIQGGKKVGIPDIMFCLARQNSFSLFHDEGGFPVLSGISKTKNLFFNLMTF